jgi:hypothetical protein
VNAQQHAQSSRHYEREAEAIRYRLSQSFAELSDRLAPGQVFDEMMTYARGGVATFFRALSNAARENPIPTFLIGAGCMMFLSGKMGMSRYLSRGGGDEGVVPGKTISEASQRARETPPNLRNKAAGAVEQMSQGEQNLGAAVQDYSASTGKQVSQSVERTRRQTAEMARQVKEPFINEQLILGAALSLAAGAALAAILPATEKEHELIGRASDAVKGTVGEAASESIEVAKGAARRVAQDAMSAAEREG